MLPLILMVALVGCAGDVEKADEHRPSANAEAREIKDEPSAELKQRQADEQAAYREAISAAGEGRWTDAVRQFEMAAAACEGVPELAPERARAALGQATAYAALENNDAAADAFRTYAAITAKAATEIERRFPGEAQPADALRVWAGKDLPEIDVTAALSLAISETKSRAMTSYVASARSVVNAIAQFEEAASQFSPFVPDAKVPGLFEQLTSAESDADRAYAIFAKSAPPPSVSRSIESVDHLYSVFKEYRANEVKRGRLMNNINSREDSARLEELGVKSKQLRRQWASMLPAARQAVEAAEAELREMESRAHARESMASSGTSPVSLPAVMNGNTAPGLESSVETRIEAYTDALSSADAARVSLLYANVVEGYFGIDSVDRAYIHADKSRFFRAWPRARYKLMDILSTGEDAKGRPTARFTMAFDVEGSKRRTGVVEEQITWDADGLIVVDAQRVLAK